MDDMFLVFPAFKLSNLGLLIYSYIYIYIIIYYIHTYMFLCLSTCIPNVLSLNLKKNAWIETRPEWPSHIPLEGPLDLDHPALVMTNICKHLWNFCFSLG